MASISVPTGSSGAAPILRRPVLKETCPVRPPEAPAVEAPLEVRQIEVERHPCVVEHELAPDDDEATDVDLEGAALPAPELRYVVAAGAEGRGRVRLHVEPGLLDADAREHDVVAAQRREARPHPHHRDLEERRRLGRGAADAQAAQLELERRRPHAQRLDAHRAPEAPLERALDEPRPPVGGAPERVHERRRDRDENDEQLAAPRHAIP